MKNKLIFSFFSLFIVFLFLGCNKSKITSPNIVLIMIDDLNDYPEEFNGHPQAITPNIKALTSSGVKFKNAYSNIDLDSQ
mgnify:FL=1